MKVDQRVNIPFLTGIFLVSLFFFTLLESTLFFLIGIPIGKLHLVGAILCSGIVCYFASGCSLKKSMWVVLLGTGILVFAVFLSCYVYDGSYDGNTYHKAITGTLKWGWNPLRETFYDFAADYPFLVPAISTWYDAYPKMTEIWAACVYILTENIEAGKCFNLLITVAAFFISYEILSQTGRYSVLQSRLCVCLCVINPVVLTQMTTYYVDGFLWQVFLICLVALLYLTFFEDGIYRKHCLYLVFVSVGIGLNIKFSALIYFGLLCGSFFCYWVYNRLREEGWIQGKKQIGKQFCFLAGSAVFGTGICGMTSYGINILRHKNPVYTMIGEGSTELITAQLPAYCKDMSNVTRFVSSLFSELNNDVRLDYIQWKVPFSCCAGEITEAMGNDTRVAGWGIFFSGIFLISVIVICWYLIRKKQERKSPELIRFMLLFFGVYAVSICVVPGLSWARYNGPLFYIPVIALLFLFDLYNQRDLIGGKQSDKNYFVLSVIWTAGILIYMLFLNLVPGVRRIVFDFCQYDKIQGELLVFQDLTEQSDQEIVIGHVYDYFEGRVFTLYDMGITNFRYDEIDKERQVEILFGDIGLCYQVPIGSDADLTSD